MEDWRMKINGTKFGSITIDGKVYGHDVAIDLSGNIIKRKKKLSKKYYGTSHIISGDEARFLYQKGAKKLILGTGQYDNVRLSKDARRFLDKKGCKVVSADTPNALTIYNRSVARKIAMFHVTC
jgi:hypothetical protein